MNQNKIPDNIHWLPDEEYQKTVAQLRLQFGGVFQSFHMYGLDVLIPGAIEECIKLCEDYGLRVRGIDKPISLELIRRHK